MKCYLYCFFAACLFFQFANSYSQEFVKVTDTNNAIVTTLTSTNYAGAAWVDFDNDHDLDLFTTPSFLFRNDGDGIFTAVATAIGANNTNPAHGTSWADFDNDGDLDCLLAGNPSRLFRNDGANIFTPLTEEALGQTNRGWACAWSDYDNNGFVDFIITHPAGFLGPPQPCFFFRNGGFGFEKIASYDFTQDLAPYTVATWSDYDLDGDQDLFLASGPAMPGVTAPDYLYENQLANTGSSLFERIQTPPGTDQQDGQTWNWIDYDNDGDLDAFITNWAGVRSRFYRNDNGTYVEITNALTIQEASLGNTWGDMDNDGDLDCIVTNEGSFSTHFYRNNGDGTFTSVSNAITEQGSTRGATLGDYDNDGDLDLFVAGGAKALFRNETQNGNNWINITCEGTTSNRAAIGTRVSAKATLATGATWQMRQVSAQNSFNSHNSLRVHFGLGPAASIDSLVISWPSGQEDTHTGVTANRFYTAVEGGGLSEVGVTSVENPTDAVPSEFDLLANYPNPFNPETVIGYRLPARTHVTLTIFNIKGELVSVLVDEMRDAGEYSTVWNGRDNRGTMLPSGTYLYRLNAGSVTLTRQMILVK